jgi:hypothetical protein
MAPLKLVLPDPSIYVINKSKLVTEAQAQAMTAACATQVTSDLAPCWGLTPVAVRYAKPTEVLPRGARVITLADVMDEPDALGYHTIDGRTGTVSGIIGVKVCTDNGAKITTGAFSVSSVLSHEVCELAVDPFCATWCDTGAGYMICAEVCDPVQSDYYVIGSVSVSSFVTASWFNAEAVKGQTLDWLGKISKPFTMSKGGYYVRWRGGKVDQVFGAELPEWVRARKRSIYSRSGQRLAGRPGKNITLGYYA